MKLNLFKILFLLSIITVLYFLYTNIFNPEIKHDYGREINGYFILSIIGSIIFSIIIFFINNNNKWFAVSMIIILLSFLCYTNFQSNLLQKTIFVNQPTSNYKLQKNAINFINSHQNIAVNLVKIIEEKIALENFENDTEITIINNSDVRFERDEIRNFNYRGKLVKRRVILTDISKYGLSTYKKDIQQFTIKDKKIQNLNLYSATFYPNKVSQYDKKRFSANEIIMEVNSKYYIKQCEIQNYIYDEKWLFKIGSDCKG